MIREYVRAAMEKAQYEIIDDLLSRLLKQASLSRSEWDSVK